MTTEERDTYIKVEWRNCHEHAIVNTFTSAGEAVNQNVVNEIGHEELERLRKIQAGESGGARNTRRQTLQPSPPCLLHPRPGVNAKCEREYLVRWFDADPDAPGQYWETWERMNSLIVDGTISLTAATLVEQFDAVTPEEELALEQNDAKTQQLEVCELVVGDRVLFEDEEIEHWRMGNVKAIRDDGMITVKFDSLNRSEADVPTQGLEPLTSPTLCSLLLACCVPSALTIPRMEPLRGKGGLLRETTKNLKRSNNLYKAPNPVGNLDVGRWVKVAFDSQEIGRQVWQWGVVRHAYGQSRQRPDLFDINFDGDARKTGGILLSDKYEVAKS